MTVKTTTPLVLVSLLALEADAGAVGLETSAGQGALLSDRPGVPAFAAPTAGAGKATINCINAWIQWESAADTLTDARVKADQAYWEHPDSTSMNARVNTYYAEDYAWDAERYIYDAYEADTKAEQKNLAKTAITKAQYSYFYAYYALEDLAVGCFANNRYSCDAYQLVKAAMVDLSEGRPYADQCAAGN